MQFYINTTFTQNNSFNKIKKRRTSGHSKRTSTVSVQYEQLLFSFTLILFLDKRNTVVIIIIISGLNKRDQIKSWIIVRDTFCCLYLTRGLGRKQSKAKQTTTEMERPGEANIRNREFLAADRARMAISDILHA